MWTAVPQVRDAAVALVAFTLDVLVFSTVGSARPGAAAAVVIGTAALGAGVLCLRRRFPVPVFALLVLHSAGAGLLVTGYSPTLGLLVALYTVAAHRHAPVAGVALLTFFLVSAGFTLAVELPAAAARGDSAVDTAQVIIAMIALIGVAAWGVGRWTRTSRESARQLQRLGVLERRKAIGDERHRIARELHDIVSHAVAVMVLQAAGAQRVLATDPGRAAAALAEIENAGVEAMNELRRMLGTLRPGDGDGPESGAVDGVRGVGDLDELMATMRRNGVHASLRHVGSARPVDRSIGLAAYRVVQEALTNVAKHAGSDAVASVALVWSDEHLDLRVTDDGGTSSRPASGLSTGTGLTGLRERAVISGGSLRSGALGDHGFEVVARLPLSPPDPPTHPSAAAVHAE